MTRPLLMFLAIALGAAAIAMSRAGEGLPAGWTERFAEDFPDGAPVEVGAVRWGRDFEAARRASAGSGKPILALFQEVPGCAGCQRFGREVLSHPLLVEAIETEFVPVVIYNNRSSGPDAELLARFNEPSWNYQVLRFLDSEGRDLVPRRDRVWSIGGVATRMVATLEAAGRPTPKYLRTISECDRRKELAQVAFAMPCYYVGEHRLGKLDGVATTEAGWFDGREVTLVRYDPRVVSLESLAEQAAGFDCAHAVYTPDGRSLAGLAGGRLDDSYRPARASEQKAQLRVRLPGVAQLSGVNAMQMTKLNAWLPERGEAALEWLSPRQRAELRGRFAN